MTWVVDCSVAIKWVVPEPLSDRADLLLAGTDELLAPDFLMLEAANTLWKKAQAKELSAREADVALDLLANGGFTLVPSAPLVARAAELARRLRHPVYDCIYLALAEAERARLITADRNLVRRATSMKPRVAAVDLKSLGA